MNTRIQLHMSFADIVIAMSEGNPGCITALVALFKQTPAIDKASLLEGIGPILTLDTLGIYGARVWVLFKHVCGHSVYNMVGLLRGVQLGFVTEKAVRDASIDSVPLSVPSFNLEEVLAKVKERLGDEFVKPEAA